MAQQDKYEVMGLRQGYQNTWKTPLMSTLTARPGCERHHPQLANGPGRWPGPAPGAAQTLDAAAVAARRP
jgi:hypothetical protein